MKMRVTKKRIETIRREHTDMGEHGIDAESAWELAEELLKAVDERDELLAKLTEGGSKA